MPPPKPTNKRKIFITRDTDGQYSMFTRSVPKPMPVKHATKGTIIFTGSGREPMSQDSILDMLGTSDIPTGTMVQVVFRLQNFCTVEECYEKNN